MMFSLKIVFYIFCVISTSICLEDDTLRFVQILFRHGDRSPTKSYPSDPVGADAWPNGLGQLTQVGMEQLHNLGQFFRRRYGTFINSTYYRDEVSIVSTDKHRTLMSAYCMLAGLYPPQGYQQWGEPDFTLGKLWQPIAVPSLPYSTDPMLSTDVPCPLYDQLHQELLLSPVGTDLVEEYQLLSTDVPCPCYEEKVHDLVHKTNEGKEFLKRYKSLIDHVKKEAGWPDDPSQTLHQMWDTYDILYCMKQHNKSEPDWVEGDRELLYELEMFNVRSQDFLYHTDHMIRLKAGTFLTRLLNNTNSWVNKELDPKKKVFFFSSHDSMVGAIMFALGIWNVRIPPYGCALLFELHEVDGKYRMKVLYKNDTMTNPLDGKPIVMHLPGCGGDSCDLETFTNLLQPVLLDDYQEECSKTRTHYSVVGVVMGVIGALLVVIIIGVAIWCHKRRKREFTYRSANFSADDNEM